MIRILNIFFVFTLFFFSSCDIINPPEQVPSYIAVNEIKTRTDYNTQGTAFHNITDSWVYVMNGEKDEFIGVFEAPFKIPALKKGRNTIRIEPGIKSGGSSTLRVLYSMMKEYVIDTVLVEGEVITINPIHEYLPATFAFMEDFDGEGISLEAVTQSTSPIQIISGTQAFENNSMCFELDTDTSYFECKALELITLPRTGHDVFLEINFKCNAYFTFGFFSRETSGGSVIEVRRPIYIFNPTSEWKKVYVNLRDNIMDSKGNEFRLYFSCTKQNNLEVGKITVCLDNIKVIYR